MRSPWAIYWCCVVYLTVGSGFIWGTPAVIVVVTTAVLVRVTLWERETPEGEPSGGNGTPEGDPKGVS